MEECALTMSLIILPVAKISSTIWPDLLPVTMLYLVFQALASVLGAILEGNL